MAQVWALMEFTNSEGKHEVGEKFDLPRTTDEEKAEFARLIETGVVADHEPPNNDEGSGRRRRERSENG